jgi:hypothetical protein
MALFKVTRGKLGSMFLAEARVNDRLHYLRPGLRRPLPNSEETDQREHHRDVAGPVESEQPVDDGDVVGEAVSGTMTRPRPLGPLKAMAPSSRTTRLQYTEGAMVDGLNRGMGIVDRWREGLASDVDLLSGGESEAGLTNGAFYGHFASKEDFVAATVADQLRAQRASSSALAPGRAGVEQYVREYLSVQHRDNPTTAAPPPPCSTRSDAPLMQPSRPTPRAHWSSSTTSPPA